VGREPNEITEELAAWNLQSIFEYDEEQIKIERTESVNELQQREA
jgi:hypothetical protein